MGMMISVLTPDRELFHGEIVSVKVPGADGQFQVLNNHAPIVSALTEGTVSMVTDVGDYRFYEEEEGKVVTKDVPGQTIRFKINGGFIEVLNNNISILVQ